MSNCFYGQLGMDKRLRDIVIAGSHDAGITEGGGNAKTQSQNIYHQAMSGVRFFDLRIHARSIGGGRARLSAYHAGGGIIKGKKTVELEGSGETVKVTRSKLTVGTWGMGLKGMLEQAKQFVTNYKSEFLIFKFDKCSNWSLIADYCIDYLGDTIFVDQGDINRRTLQDLKGKVIVLFSEKGFAETGHLTYYAARGIKKWRNVYDKENGPKAYDSRFDGLQYSGKGGTTLNPIKMKWTMKGKIKDNEKTQLKRMKPMIEANGVMSHSSDVLGMMYWTSTGYFENIQKRNTKMWEGANVDRMKGLWEGGLYDSIRERSEHNRIKRTNYASGPQLKAFIPNIIMMDFANDTQCTIVYDLNTIASTALVDMLAGHEDD
ncbi:MAG: hypothetical protein F9B45_25465 [Phycisphaera sp. RhM]|nr:hypothetical protein [Phycisphaera sp. RhM]